MKGLSLICLISTLLVGCYSQNDPCYNTPDSNLGMIGSCVPESACNGVTQGGLCPSFPGDHTCCFDVNLPGREVRGAWMATVANIDWPLAPGGDPEVHKGQLRHLIDSLVDVGMNTLYFQVRPMGDALYASDLEPWSRYLTGTQGTGPNPPWDPLQYAIDYSHERGAELHAWINPYRANSAPNSNGLASNHMARRFPQYAYGYGNQLWMDPGAPAVADFTYSVCIDLVTRYNIDGIHMDDYFYPYPVSGVDFPDSSTWNDYVNSGGGLSRADWRRDNVNRLVQRINDGVHAVKPHIKYSVSPFGIYRPGHPEGMPSSINGFDQYTGLFADPKLWLQQGWMDVLQPQLYWEIDPPAQSYRTLLDWWVSINSQGRHVYAGNALYRVPDNGWLWNEIRRQVGISRENVHRSRGSWGNVAFSAKYIRDNYEGAQNVFKSFYPYPAIQPEFPWLARNAKAYPPQRPKVIKVEKDHVFINDPEFKTAIYRLDGKEFKLERVLIDNSEIRLSSGKYGVTSVDRYGQESEMTFVEI